MDGMEGGGAGGPGACVRMTFCADSAGSSRMFMLSKFISPMQSSRLRVPEFPATFCAGIHDSVAHHDFTKQRSQTLVREVGAKLHTLWPIHAACHRTKFGTSKCNKMAKHRQAKQHAIPVISTTLIVDSRPCIEGRLYTSLRAGTG